MKRVKILRNYGKTDQEKLRRFTKDFTSSKQEKKFDALYWLSLQNDNELKKQCLALVMERFFHESDPSIREEVIKTLRKPHYVPYTDEELDVLLEALSDCDSHVRVQAVYALIGHFGDNPGKDIPFCISILKNDMDVGVRNAAEDVLKPEQKIMCDACGKAYVRSDYDEEYYDNEYGDSMVVGYCPKGHEVYRGKSSIAY